MNSMQHSRRVRGFSLIEVLLSVAVMSFGLLALATLQVSMMRQSSETKSQSVGLALAKQKMEQLRGYSGINGYYALTDSSAAESINVGGIGYSRSWTVTRYAYPTAGGEFAVISSDTGATPSGYVANNEFKRLVVTVGWSDATGAAQSVAVEDAISGLSPDDSAKLVKPQRNVRPRGPEIVIANPENTAGVIPIAVGNGSETAATNPRPEVVSQGNSTTVIETRFDVLTYAAITGTTNALAQQRVETAVIGCTCSASSSGTQAGFRPTYWDGLRYAVPTSHTYSGVRTPANVTQSARCEACCRDHRDPSGVTGPKFDPRRTDGHKHFNTSLADSDAVTSGTYREACRMIRVDGIFRTAADLYNDYFGLLATGSSSASTAPDATMAGNYEAFVLDYLSARYVNGTTALFNSPSNYTSTISTAEGTRSLNTPTNTFISSSTAPKWTHSRGLYIDNLEDEAKALIEAAKASCGSTQACVLKYVPFTSINLTEIADWQATITTSPYTASTSAIQVSNNSFATSLTDTNPVRGKVLVGNPASPNSQGLARSKITPSNAGVALFSAVDGDGDSTVLADGQQFEIGSGSPPNNNGGTFSVTLAGAIASPVSASVANNPPKVTFTISSISVDCSTNGLAVLPYGCATTTGQDIGQATSFLVTNYNRQDNATVQNSCTRNANASNAANSDTTPMPYRTVMDVTGIASSNTLAVITPVGIPPVGTVTNNNGIGLPAANGEYTTFTVTPVSQGNTITVTMGNVSYLCPSNYATFITNTGDDAGKTPDNGNSSTVCSGSGNNKVPVWSTTYVACPGSPLQ